jgi:hypothetical protein
MIMTEAIDSLGNVLARFDRKERGWVVRKALGAKAEYLDEGFLKQVCGALGLETAAPQEYRWFTDYHLDWLVAALQIYAYGEKRCLAHDSIFPNSAAPNPLIMGNQEDVDLLLVTGTDLILIEAKWFGLWNNTQRESKLGRLKMIKKAADLACIQANRDRVKFHFLLMSAAEAHRNPDPLRQVSEADDGMVRRLQIPPSVDAPPYMLAPQRCNANGSATAIGANWRVIRCGIPGSRNGQNTSDAGAASGDPSPL